MSTYRAPSGALVFGAGSVQWAHGLGRVPFDMTRDDKGVWTVTTPPAVPRFHYYWFSVDGFAATAPGSATFFGWAKPTSGIAIC